MFLLLTALRCLLTGLATNTASLSFSPSLSCIGSPLSTGARLGGAREVWNAFYSSDVPYGSLSLCLQRHYRSQVNIEERERCLNGPMPLGRPMCSAPGMERGRKMAREAGGGGKKRDCEGTGKGGDQAGLKSSWCVCFCYGEPIFSLHTKKL